LLQGARGLAAYAERQIIVRPADAGGPIPGANLGTFREEPYCPVDPNPATPRGASSSESVSSKTA